MAGLDFEGVRKIGITAIRRVIGDSFSDVETGYTFGADDQAYYLFTLRFSTEQAWRQALSRSSEMGRAINDELWAKGDERLAFTRLLSDGSWDFRQHAAAE